jgi:DNA-directed RNA polymerase subunit RPC12/RpoP
VVFCVSMDPQLEASNVLAWILGNGFVNEYNKPLEFTKHRFLIDYMVDNHPVIVTKKCAQVGLTVSEVLKSVHYSAYKKLNVIHTLQTSDVVDGFVFPKVNPIIEYNPKIKELLQSTDSKTLKRFGDNFVFYRGANAESQAINITGDVLCIDEYDRSNQNVVEIYQSRLDASEYKWKRYFSNPSAVGFGVDGLYNQSDQRHWFVQCPHCNHRSWIEFEQIEDSHFVNVDKGVYACGKCKKEIYDKDRINGEWVAKFPSKDWHGYWFSQLMAPWKSAMEIVEIQQTSGVEYFHNFVLGKAYTSTDLIVNRDTIMRACKPALIPKTNVAIGVDNGIIKHWVAATPDGVFDYGKTENWNDIERLILMYNAVMVIDALPDFTIPKQLVQKYKGKVFVNYYVPDTKNLGVVRWGKEAEFGVVKTDRTKLLDLVASEITTVKLPYRQQPRELEAYIKHWENVFRTTTLDEKTGIEKGNWTHQEHKPDHWVHAHGYMRIALSRLLGGTFGMEFAEPNLTKEARKTDYIDSEGLHTDLGERIEQALEGTMDVGDWRYV